MARKKRKAPQLEAWCWYCDREFEDEKGGLSVHLTQVHKAQPDKIENTLPGRDSFEIEIYGMAGIPETDLAEWKERRAAQRADGNVPVQNKRPRIEKLVLSKEQLRIQLAAHKALMSGQAPMPGLGAGPPPGFPPAGPFSVPPPAFGVPPPNFARPPPTQPPPGFGAPPPGSMPNAPPGYAPPAGDDGRDQRKVKAADLF
ncbi:hypothetical protein PaG_05552 [Moesziomyces aphidis]|uniref:Zinc finger protein n=3 Tax=Moesziomyces TaxID=63261 RepID=A0A081CLB3_PSEA2|nr:uncharacterized protein PAN0_018d5687 [Moesziomyces antarcticus]ETS60351.1 hypothetical protein PaG_05552 [Moesziomyces aphidis]GAC76257.1 hypothetical protein PANT_20d00024 [Moesziomyces antarcticus T-34]GAK67459.1 conserved hypothetical protein [Moesziomyces antarcticus]